MYWFFTFFLNLNLVHISHPYRTCYFPAHRASLLGAFAKLRKAIICFVMSVCPSVRMEQLGSHWKDFNEI